MKSWIKYGVPLVVIILVVFFTLKGNDTDIKFDSEEWKKWEESETTMSMRWDMVNSLKSNHRLIGKHKVEIIKLLGTPEFESENGFMYSLGYSRCGINTGALSFVFDESERVIDFDVWDG